VCRTCVCCTEMNGRMYPFYFDCGGSSSVNPWLNTADCKPPAIFDDCSTSWITPLSRTLSPTSTAYFPAGASTFYPSAHSSRYVNRRSSPSTGVMSRCDVMESSLTSYSCVTSSLGNPLESRNILSSSSGVDNALMSAALLHSAAAAAEVNMMKNLPEQLTNTGVINDSATTAAAEALRLRTKSRSSSGSSRFSSLV